MTDTMPAPQSGRMLGLEVETAVVRADGLQDVLRRGLQMQASDVHLTVGLPPVYRIHGDLEPGPGRPLRADDLRTLIYGLLTQGQREEFEREWQLCCSLVIGDLGQFRVTVYYHSGVVEASIRICPPSILSPEELGLPQIAQELVAKRSGLVLITGPTGSGKTTTLNCLIDLINRSRRCKIITVEDPVEFSHSNRLSVVVQQQVHSDTRSFARALTHILRQDPDVIGVGEMRDLETIGTALTAAETGHLVLATLHTPNATQTVDRIVDAFPGDQQPQILTQLAASLQGVIAQLLLPRLDSEGRALATEVLVATPAVRNMIRERKIPQLPSALETGRVYGMHLMDHSLRDLYQRGVISYDDALAHAAEPQRLGIRREAGTAIEAAGYAAGSEEAVERRTSDGRAT